MKRIQCAFLGVVVFFLLGSFVASAEDIVKCRARVTNRMYDVTLNKDTLLLEVITDNGYYYKGFTTFRHSPAYREDVYYLPKGYESGFEMAFELNGAKRIAFCLKSSECYLCYPSKK